MKRRHLIFLPLLPAVAQAHSYSHETIAIGHAWALATHYVDGQVFVPLLNTGKAPDALVAARSEACAYVELRLNNRYDHPAEERFDLPPAKPLAMRPTARHLRLVGLAHPLEEGQSLSLVLDFEHAGEIEIIAEIEPAPQD